jgi:nucleotide-binding universal stress UspA family protein
MIFLILHAACMSHFIARCCLTDKETNETPLGDPRHAIANMVESSGASMLVVGSRGLGAVKRAVLGSVSESLVRCCSGMGCAVIVARASKEEKSVK